MKGSIRFMVLVSRSGPRHLCGAVVLCSCLCGSPLLRAQSIQSVPSVQSVQPAQPKQTTPTLETPQETNERIRSLSLGAKNIPHDYVIGEGDVISVSVFDVPEMTRDLRVSQTGTISIPLVPVRLRVSGLTELQTEQKIAEILETNGLVSHPEVAVMVKEHKSKPITIVGAVAHPMVYEADRQVTLLEALAQAGGVAPDAGDTVIVTRPHSATFVELSDSGSGTAVSKQTAAPGAGEPPALDEPLSPANGQGGQAASNAPVFPGASGTQTAPTNGPAAQTGVPTVPNPGDGPITINLNDLLESGDTRNNIVLQAGDVVTVPHAGIVYVLGAVTRPGGFVVANDRSALTALKILSLAGGTTNIAKLDHAVIIRRDATGKQSETEVDLKKILKRESEDVQMRPSDILFVPDSRSKEALLKAAELGVAVGTAVAIFRLAY